MLNPIGEYLKKSINKAGIGKEVEAARVCQFWKTIIEKVFSREIAEKSKALRFKNGTLVVAVSSPVLAQEFRFRESEIVERLNKKSGSDIIRKIRFEM